MTGSAEPQIRSMLTCNNMEALKGATMAGLGIACMPDFLVCEQLLETLAFREVPVLFGSFISRFKAALPFLSRGCRRELTTGTSDYWSGNASKAAGVPGRVDKTIPFPQLASNPALV